MCTLSFWQIAGAVEANPLSNYMSGAYPRTVSRFTALMDVSTGKILYCENDFCHRPPASLTKMTAAIVLIENGKLTDTVTAPAAVKGTPESSLHLSPGEKISLHDLLYAMMLRSANDTPIAGSYYLCGGIPPFVELMNKKVQEIGCANTHFVTPNGLYAAGHYSCAYDLALIARYGLTHLPAFREIVRTRSYRVTRSIHKGDSLVTNTAMTFLSDFPGADGVKTGYISQAGHCFVGSASRHGWQLIAVALDSPECRSDVVQLLSYGFAHFKPHLIYKRGYDAGVVSLTNRQVAAVTGADLMDVDEAGAPQYLESSYDLRTVALPIAQADAVTLGEKIGTVTMYHAGTPIMTVDAVAAQAVPGTPITVQARIGKSGFFIKAVIAAVAAIILLPLLYVGGRLLDLAIHARKIAKNSRRRRARVAEDIGAVDP